MRTDIIATKTKQVQQELAEWAKEKGVLDPGEQLVFTLRVESGPTVVCASEDAEAILGMTLAKFFTFDRVSAMREARTTVNRALNALENEVRCSGAHNWDNCTTKEFLTVYPTYQDLLKITNIGAKTADLLSRVILAAGLPFKGRNR